jgi:hypothetical protein
MKNLPSRQMRIKKKSRFGKAIFQARLDGILIMMLRIVHWIFQLVQFLARETIQFQILIQQLHRTVGPLLIRTSTVVPKEEQMLKIVG